MATCVPWCDVGVTVSCHMHLQTVDVGQSPEAGWGWRGGHGAQQTLPGEGESLWRVPGCFLPRNPPQAGSRGMAPRQPTSLTVTVRIAGTFQTQLHKWDEATSQGFQVEKAITFSVWHGPQGHGWWAWELGFPGELDESMGLSWVAWLRSSVFGGPGAPQCCRSLVSKATLQGFLGGTISPGPRGGRHSSFPTCRSKPRGQELRLLLARGSEPPRPVTFQASGMFSALQGCLFNTDPTQG